MDNTLYPDSPFSKSPFSETVYDAIDQSSTVVDVEAEAEASYNQHESSFRQMSEETDYPEFGAPVLEDPTRVPKKPSKKKSKKKIEVPAVTKTKRSSALTAFTSKKVSPKIKLPSVYMGTGFLSGKSLPIEAVLFSLIWALAVLLEYELPDKLYGWVRTGTNPILISFISFVLCVCVCRQDRYQKRKLKAEISDMSRPTFASVTEVVDSYVNRSNRTFDKLASLFMVLVSFQIVFGLIN